jgi:hypothetical protein
MKIHCAHLPLRTDNGETISPVIKKKFPIGNSIGMQPHNQLLSQRLSINNAANQSQKIQMVQI